MVGPELTRRLPYYKELKLTALEMFGCVLLLGTSFLQNYMRKRPMSSSVPKHVLFAAVGLVVGKECDKYLELKRNQKMLVIEDYISKHPEDFPIVTPKKYKDVLLPWAPLR